MNVNLQQLRYIVEIARRERNVSEAAAALHTSQPGVSKQVKLLEQELGFEIFERSRNRFSGITVKGAQVIACAARALEEIGNIGMLSQEHKRPASGVITIATSHTQARYVLSDAMRRFAAVHPKVRISLCYGDPGQLPGLVQSGRAHIAVTTDTARGLKELMAIPYRRFQRVVIVPRGHELLQSRRITLKLLARHPLVTYEPQFTGRSAVVKAFEAAGLVPKLLVSAIDADVIKMCVGQGMGIAVLSEVAFDARADAGLRAIAAGHLFEPSTTSLLLHRSRYLPQHAYDFIETFMPSLTKAEVHRAALR